MQIASLTVVFLYTLELSMHDNKNVCRRAVSCAQIFLHCSECEFLREFFLLSYIDIYNVVNGYDIWKWNKFL